MVSFLSTFDRSSTQSDALASNRTSSSPPYSGLQTSRSKAFSVRPVSNHPVARLAVGTLLNGGDCWIPTEFVHSSRWTETCQVAQVVSDAGGFEAGTFCTPVTTAQIWLTGCRDSHQARRHINAAAAELLQVGLGIEPGQRIPIGCIPALSLLDHGNGVLEAVLSVESTDAVCSRVMRAAAQAMAPRLAHLAETRRGPDIQHGIVESERVRVRCGLRLCCLSHARQRRSADATSGARRVMACIARLEQELVTDRHQPALTATHNDHVLEGLAAAAAGSNVDPNCFTVTARSHAARWGSCEPLARWRINDDMLLGELSMPVDLAMVGDSLSLRVQHEVSFRTVRDVVNQVATIGLASSVAYLRWRLAAG
jgi:hypothetical protein